MNKSLGFISRTQQNCTPITDFTYYKPLVTKNTSSFPLYFSPVNMPTRMLQLSIIRPRLQRLHSTVFSTRSTTEGLLDVLQNVQLNVHGPTETGSSTPLSEAANIFNCKRRRYTGRMYNYTHLKTSICPRSVC